MREVIRYKLLDGTLYDTYPEAKKHADQLYGNELSRIVHLMLKETDGKYGRTMTWMNEHLADFVQLHKYREDQVLEDSDDGESGD